MDIRRSSILADILNILSDGEVHTLQEIADKTEVSKMTVRRYIESLSFRYPINSFHGGDKRGGVYLDKRYLHQGQIMSIEKLQILNRALGLLQESKCEDVNQEVLKELLRDFAPPTKTEGNKNEKESNFSC